VDLTKRFRGPRLMDRKRMHVPVVEQCFQLAVVNAGFALGLVRGLVGAARGTFETE
jgi:hypothetical protein